VKRQDDDPPETPRVLRIITRLNIGGPAIQAIDLTRQLPSRGFSTRLIHGRLGPSEGNMQNFLRTEGLPVTYVRSLVRPVAPMLDLRALWVLYRQVCAYRPHIIHTHMAKAGTLGRLAGILYNRTLGRSRPARLVHTYHGHVFDGYFGGFSTNLFLAVERWIGRRTDALVAISQHVKHDLLSTYNIARDSQIALVPLGFDLSRFLAVDAGSRLRARALLDIPDAAVVVSTVGCLTDIKQQTAIVDAAAALRDTETSFLFLIVGDGELRGSLEQRARERGVPDAVRFLGWRQDLETVYAATDIFLLTSRNEGTPVALIEAMASGVPIVSTDVGGVRDVVPSKDYGILVPFGSPADLAESLKGLAASPALRETLGCAGRQFVRERFDRERLMRDMTDLYWRLLNFPTTIQ